MIQKGLTLIELVLVIAILSILSAVAIPRFLNLGTNARISSMSALSGALNTAMSIVHAQVMVQGPGSKGTQVNITWISLGDGTRVRLWNTYPDRWCDGVGAIVQGVQAPAGDSCYLSSAAVPTTTNIRFYGYGNSQSPAGNAGWRDESATNATYCSVEYVYNGTIKPVVITNTSGC